MVIKRDTYIELLDAKMFNGKVKIITGVRRCGKSYLLFNLYKQHLVEDLGVPSQNIIEIALDRSQFSAYRNPLKLDEYARERMSKVSGKVYLFVDEIQMSYKIKNGDVDEKNVAEEDREMLYTTFYDVLNDLMAEPDLDIYVTGSNSKMLSEDIVTNFRDRGCEIRVRPLSFAEYYPVSGMEKSDAFETYMRYGGMPLAVLESDERQKHSYLKGLYKNVYLKDIVERHKIKDESLMSSLVDVLCSSTGSLTNPKKLSDSATSLLRRPVSDVTVKSYLGHLTDAFLFEKANRYDIKGKRYLLTPQKYYSTDVGLRNARLNFRQQDPGHLMENIIYNELVGRGYSVDVGMVEVRNRCGGTIKQSQHEIDFVVNTGSQKIYIQSALYIDSPEKKAQETFSIRNSGDFFRKIVVVGGSSLLTTDDDGISYIGIIPFLLTNILE